MTIRHFYFVLAYVIWAYIVLCCLAKLFFDLHCRKKTARRQKAIEQYFLPLQDTGNGQHCSESRILNWCHNPVLLACACRAYRQNLPQYAPQEQHSRQKLIVQLLNSASDRVGEDGMKSCYTIAAMAGSCDLTADEVKGMKPQAKPESELEEYWYSVAVRRRGEA